MIALPDAAEHPLMTVDELLPFLPGLGRSAAYEAVRRGDLPSVRIGSRVFVPTAELRRRWGVEEGGPPSGGPPSETSTLTAGEDDEEQSP